MDNIIERDGYRIVVSGEYIGYAAVEEGYEGGEFDYETNSYYGGEFVGTGDTAEEAVDMLLELLRERDEGLDDIIGPNDQETPTY